MSTLRETLNQKATQFANDVLAAIRGASVQDLLDDRAEHSRKLPKSAAKAPEGRLRRRSQKEILASAQTVADMLRKKGLGLRAEQIQKELGLDKRESPRILREGVKARILTSKGQKRSTVYSAAGKAKGGK